MKVNNISNTNFTGRSQGLKKSVSSVATKIAPKLEDTFVAAKVKLTQATNSDFIAIIRKFFAC